MTTPTDQQLDEIETRANARRTALSGWINCYSPLSEQETLEGAEAVLEEDVPALLAEVRRLRTELEGRTEDVAFLERTTLPELRREIEHHKDGKQRWRERAEKAEARVAGLAPQQCPAGLHADWLVDSEYAHACPWCQIDRLRADAAAELLPAWEAMYEPGNVSDYLIGYMNDQDAATGAAEAWMRSQAEVTGRLEWVPWGDVTPMPDGYDRWFELAQQHDDGIDTGPGIVVRRRVQPATP